ncbi:ankyrin [Cryphonectria parasitica EP155]|uniref:Ankyrin n=1 Tax=Cryphonectria parasitica (strain ATCC 38755 / EP155) TaxID=660469 RepID=A0A9P4XUX1_CRYP1|nr:ankyrin [Cryphonectria parasitica EP155]KAF3761737.1 ankyrin [Cryphonectria parasitica EP155]
MVRGFLDAGVDIHGGDKHNCNPLIIAARYCHEVVVDFIMERGADPNDCQGQQRGSALCSAAAGGSLAIMRKLIDRGARPTGWAGTMLKHAVLLEHEAMLQLLWERGLIEPSNRPNALRAASDEGLESMVKLLHQCGVGNSSN